jgi:transmembrane protein 33
MWFLTPSIFLALVPYFIYSIFHVVTYASEYVIPAATGHPAKPDDKVLATARKYQDTGAQIVSKVEVYGILIRLLFGVILYLLSLFFC